VNILIRLAAANTAVSKTTTVAVMHKLTSGGSPILTNIKSIIALVIKENNSSDVFGKMSPK